MLVGIILRNSILFTTRAAMIGATVILVDPVFQCLAISLHLGLISSTTLIIPVIPAIHWIAKT